MNFSTSGCKTPLQSKSARQELFKSFCCLFFSNSFCHLSSLAHSQMYSTLAAGQRVLWFSANFAVSCSILQHVHRVWLSSMLHLATWLCNLRSLGAVEQDICNYEHFLLLPPSAQLGGSSKRAVLQAVLMEAPLPNILQQRSGLCWSALKLTSSYAL